MILKKIIKKFDKSTIKAGEGLESGIYPLYTCSQIVNKFLDDYLYDDEAIIVSTGGNFSIHYIKGKFNYSTDCYVFNTDKYNLKYLYYYLLSKSNDINKMFRGAGLKHLNKNEFVNLNIKDISIDKQENIVNRLDKINQMITLRKKEIDYCNCLIKSQFVEMFKCCPQTKLCEIANITMGQSPNSESYNDSADGIPFFQGKADYGDKYTIIKHWTNQPSKLAYKGDVLMSVRAPVGPVNISSCDCCIGRGLCSITAKDGLTNNEFLFNALNTIQVEIATKGTGSTFKAITKNDVYNIELPLGSIKLQNKFARIVEQIDKQKFVNINIFQLLDKMFQKCYNNLIDFY